MPLKWERNRNPYVSNYFGKLHMGPNVVPTQIIAQARGIVQMLANGREVKCAGGYPLDEHAVNEASKKLTVSNSHAEELLLVHSQPQREDKKDIKTLVTQLRQKAVLAADRSPVPLQHPASIFWFLPPPGPESAELPPWEAFGSVEPGDPDDLELDIKREAGIPLPETSATSISSRVE